MANKSKVMNNLCGAVGARIQKALAANATRSAFTLGLVSRFISAADWVENSQSQALVKKANPMQAHGAQLRCRWRRISLEYYDR